MTLSSIAPGANIFIDSNIFIYHFTGVSYECSDFLDRCEKGDISGITTVNVLLEVLHRLMMIEAVEKGLVSSPNIIKKLKKKPEKIQQLHEYFINTQKIIEMGVVVKPISFEMIVKSQSFRLKHGLFTNDSLLVSALQDEATISLATNDKCFSKVEKLIIYSPGDINLSASK